MFVPLKVDHSLSALTNRRDFLPLSGACVHHKLLRGLLFVGNKTAGKAKLKATTAGRNTVAKCSPMERSTLQRGPTSPRVILQTDDRGDTSGLSRRCQSSQASREGA